MNDQILVSVVVPVYNDEPTIAGTLESALAQNFDRPFEVIVVNDGSTDGTRALLAAFGEKIRVIDQENKGVSAARNAGIAAASGKYVALLDGDDAWHPYKLAKTVPVLEKNPECVAVFSNVVQVDGSGRKISEWVPPRFDHSPTLAEMLEVVWPILPSSIVIRRAALLAAGGFSTEFKSGHYAWEDSHMFLMLREHGDFVYVPEILARRRLREFGEHFSRMPRSKDIDPDSREAFQKFIFRFGGNLIFARLTLRHFGVRGRKVAAFAVDEVARELVTVGMMAIHEGNRRFARRCYLKSLRHRPLMLKTWFRLGWAMVPERVAQMLSPMLAPRLRRSLSGPPAYVLDNRGQ